MLSLFDSRSNASQFKWSNNNTVVPKKWGEWGRVPWSKKSAGTPSPRVPAPLHPWDRRTDTGPLRSRSPLEASRVKKLSSRRVSLSVGYRKRAVVSRQQWNPRRQSARVRLNIDRCRLSCLGPPTLKAPCWWWHHVSVLIRYRYSHLFE